MSLVTAELWSSSPPTLRGRFSVPNDCDHVEKPAWRQCSGIRLSRLAGIRTLSWRLSTAEDRHDANRTQYSQSSNPSPAKLPPRGLVYIEGTNTVWARILRLPILSGRLRV